MYVNLKHFFYSYTVSSSIEMVSASKTKLPTLDSQTKCAHPYLLPQIWVLIALIICVLSPKRKLTLF